jgi:hypothetical protein
VVKIRYSVTVEVDDDAWALEYGVERSDVRDDVKSYLDNMIDDGESVAAELMKRLAQR